LISATLDDEVPANFYTTNLILDELAVTDWSDTLPVDASESVSLNLWIPEGTEAGNKVATLVFWAEEIP